MGFKSARLNAGKKGTETAKYMGVNRMAVYQWEHGINAPTASKLVKLAAYYGCTVDELLRDNPKHGE